MMKVVVMNGVGDVNVMELLDREIPTPGVGEVLIKVAAAGVNRPDVAQRQGLYPPPPNASPILGLEVAGQIVGGDWEGSPFSLGDDVCALTPGGGYAEYCIAPVTHCLPVPQGLTLVEAAALPETFFTVWVNVFQRAALRSGETFLVHGGSSGIGTTAIQMAKVLGAQVFATVGSQAKAQAIEQLGAYPINYREEDFEQVIKERTQGRGVDVVLDMIGAAYFAKNLNILAFDGRLSIIALLGGARAEEVDLAKILMRRLRVMGSTLRPQSNEFKARVARELHENIWPLIAEAKLKPLISKVFSLSEVKQAHLLMETSEHIGKIILTP